jgi:hypothetical protein
MLTATTYRTPSATTTGLNLGTRTLAAQANVVNVANPLRSALDQSHQRMCFQRFGMRGYSLLECIPIIPSLPRWPASFGGRPGVEGFADSPPEAREVIVVDGLAVPVVRPGDLVRGKRRHAAAKAARPAAAAARPSTRPAALIAAGG